MKEERLIVLLLAACASAPPPPAEPDLGIDAPPAFSAAAVAAAAEKAGSAIPETWWREFGDERLDQFVQATLQGNFDLRAAAARLEAAASTRIIAASGALPQVDASFDTQRSKRLFLGFPFGGGGGVPSSTATTFGLSLSLRWELDVWGRIRAGEGAAIADLQASAADHAAARLSLVAQACKGWFVAAEARQQLDLAIATVAAFQGTTDDVRDRYRRGLRPALDVHLAATNLANAEALVLQRRQQLQEALRQLDVLAGRYPRGLVEGTVALPAVLPVPPAGLPATLLQRRPDLLAAERRLAAAGCRVDATTAALYPRIALTASGGTASEDLEDLVDDDFRVWSLAANLLQPLFRGGALRADVARSEALRAEAIAHYGSAVLRAFAEVEDGLAAETLLAERHVAVGRAAEHARQARDLARQRWQLGLLDFLAVADGQRQAFLADSSLITLQRQRIDNRIALFLALGGGFAVHDGSDHP